MTQKKKNGRKKKKINNSSTKKDRLLHKREKTKKKEHKLPKKYKKAFKKEPHIKKFNFNQNNMKFMKGWSITKDFWEMIPTQCSIDEDLAKLI